ncbi:LacI family DNA-binding transcriptional regulator [Harryflintia acetispora]|uniref:LacI family DNA-binding transcriptional regulator n=1 Tax=Harryflintia acetispora TaxID=1849041 RepID=UPI00189AF75F|nr:LacI family DNA-binding transcriptional regulator [Harryflintia acetispora]
MKVSIRQISELSGFSPATVSNVLNNKKGVNKDTAELILKIARESGYISENRISSIKLVIFKRSGLVVADTPFFSSLIEGVEKESGLHGFETTVCNLDKKSPDFKMRLEQVLGDHNSGILLLATELGEEDVKLFRRAIAPVVVLDSWFDTLSFDTVLINNTDSVCGAVDYLIRKGHRNIGYLSSAIPIKNFYYRGVGFRRAHSRHGLRPNADYVVRLTPTMDGAYHDMLAYLKTSPKLPTAYFADNDIIAFGAMKALQESGVRIPEDVSIVGFDDMPFCSVTSPTLTTIRVFKQEMGCMAVRRLLEKMKSKSKVCSKIQICTEFVERESVRKLPEE